MNTQFTGVNKIYFSQLDSTINQAWNLLDSTPEEGTLIYTDYQYSGKGQRGNTWVSSPYKNIALSIIYYPSFLAIEHIFYLNKIVSLAVKSTISSFLPQSIVKIKWPNDILTNNKKIAGILIENQLEGHRIKSSILGIGINVNEEEFPEQLADKATSMFLQMGKSIHQEEVISFLMEKLEQFYMMLEAGKQDEIDSQYLSQLFGYQEITILTANQITQPGIICGVDVSGKLMVKFKDKISTFDIKEIRFQL